MSEANVNQRSCLTGSLQSNKVAARTGVRYIAFFEDQMIRPVWLKLKGHSELVSRLNHSGLKQNWLVVEESPREHGFWSGEIPIAAGAEHLVMDIIKRLADS